MRIGQGLSASGGFIVGRAVVRDAFSGSRGQRAMSKTGVRTQFSLILEKLLSDPNYSGDVPALFLMAVVLWLLNPGKLKQNS